MGGERRPTLRARTVPQSSLSDPDRATMFALFDRYYEHVSSERFQADLRHKDHVIMLRDPTDNSIRGFSTLKRMRTTLDGVVHQVIYSGDTIIDDKYWGGAALGKAFLAYLFRARLRHPRSPLWWFLISKGYKTYLLMANNFPEHWPRYERNTPSMQQRLLHQLAGTQFGEAYHAEDGVVRFTESQGQLRGGVAAIDDDLLEHPRIHHFVQRNPGWQQGDELVCLARMTWMMPLQYAWKKRRIS